MTADQAPRSSQRARLKILRHLPEAYEYHLDRMAVTTAVREMADGNHRAVTTVTRPCAGGPDARRYAFDNVVLNALRELPGADGNITITVGHTYEVEWDGVRVPV